MMIFFQTKALSTCSLCRLHSIQQAIKQHSVAAASLRERISEGGVGLGAGGAGESALLRRLLHRTKPPAHARHHQLTAARREVEEVKLRVNLLTHERDKKRAQLRLTLQDKNRVTEENLDKGRFLSVDFIFTGSTKLILFV